MSTGAATVENGVEVAQKIKNMWNYHVVLQPHFWVFIQRKLKH